MKRTAGARQRQPAEIICGEESELTHARVGGFVIKRQQERERQMGTGGNSEGGTPARASGEEVGGGRWMDGWMDKAGGRTAEVKLEAKSWNMNGKSSGGRL